MYINQNVQKISGEVMIVEKEQVDTFYVYTVIYQFKKYNVNLNQSYDLGTLLSIDANVESYQLPSIPGGFDSKTYHLGHNIYGRLRSIKINKVEDDHFMVSLYRLIDWNTPFIKLIKDQEILNVNLYSFLFTLSSVHLALIILLLRKWMYYLDIKNPKKQRIISIIMFILFVVGGSIILLRMALINGFIYFVKKFKWSFTRLDIECMTTISMIILMPHIIFNQTFILVSLFVLYNQLVNLKASLSQSLLIPLLLVPFMLSWEHEIALFTFFVIPLLMRLARYILIPLMMILILFPFMTMIPTIESVLNQLLTLFDFKFDRIYLPTLPWYGVILYLLLIIWIYSATNLKGYIKRLSLLSSLIIFGFFVTFLPRADEVIFLDVGQGDAAVIFKNQKTIVVDAFGDVQSYLKFRYIKTIDYLILTHSDQDHMKNAKDLINEFEVKFLVLSGYLDYQLEHPNIINIKEDRLFTIEEINLEFLAPFQSYQSTNECSIVFKIEVNELSYIFTGDISVTVENQLILRYGLLLDVDVLKVAHHGSMTSSSLDWLRITSPTYAIMSVARYNIYGFPDQDIIERYRSLGIYLYLTSENGSISFTENEVRMFS